MTNERQYLDLDIILEALDSYEHVCDRRRRGVGHVKIGAYPRSYWMSRLERIAGVKAYIAEVTAKLETPEPVETY